MELQQLLHKEPPSYTDPAQGLQENAAPLRWLHPRSVSRWPWPGIALVHTPVRSTQLPAPLYCTLDRSLQVRLGAFADFTQTTSPQNQRDHLTSLSLSSPLAYPAQ